MSPPPLHPARRRRDLDSTDHQQGRKSSRESRKAARVAAAAAESAGLAKSPPEDLLSPETKVTRLQRHCREKLKDKANVDYESLTPGSQLNQQKQRRCMRYYTRSRREKTCEDVTDMLPESEGK